MKTLPKNYIFKFQNVAWARVAQRSVIVIIAREKNFLDIIHSIYSTTPCGLDILEGLLAKRPLLSIVKSLAKKYRVSSGRMRNDVIEFLELLTQKRLFSSIP
ncbi:MAG: PqqD family protein [Candidatus Omnitrophota bacterium]